MDDLTKELLIEIANTILRVLVGEQEIQKKEPKQDNDEYYRSNHEVGTAVFGTETFERFTVGSDHTLRRSDGSCVKKGEKI